MNLRVASVGALVLMVAGIVSMAMRHELFARSVAGIVVQAAAVGLMIWARLVFGLRSFHAAANPTRGGLVTTGPYHSEPMQRWVFRPSPRRGLKPRPTWGRAGPVRPRPARAAVASG